jgi:hypothetical protein
MRTEDLQGVAFREWVLNSIQYYYFIVLQKKQWKNSEKISETENINYCIHTKYNHIWNVSCAYRRTGIDYLTPEGVNSTSNPLNAIGTNIGQVWHRQQKGVYWLRLTAPSFSALSLNRVDSMFGPSLQVLKFIPQFCCHPYCGSHSVDSVYHLLPSSVPVKLG